MVKMHMRKDKYVNIIWAESQFSQPVLQPVKPLHRVFLQKIFGPASFISVIDSRIIQHITKNRMLHQDTVAGDRPDNSPDPILLLFLFGQSPRDPKA